jgi:hypothetical protein
MNHTPINSSPSASTQQRQNMTKTQTNKINLDFVNVTYIKSPLLYSVIHKSLRNFVNITYIKSPLLYMVIHKSLRNFVNVTYMKSPLLYRVIHKSLRNFVNVTYMKSPLLYSVIHKSLWNFRPLRYSSRDGHVEGEHVNRGTDTPSFCPTLQVLDMSKLGDAVDVNPVIKFLPHTLQHPAVDNSDCLHDPLSKLW